MNPTANNGNGGLLTVRGKSKRMSAVDISHRGVPVNVEYVLEGDYLFATLDEPAEIPQCVPQIISVGGVEVWNRKRSELCNLLSESQVDDIAEQIEGEWK